MNIKEILANTNHRPWPLPQGSWKYYQEWNRAIFLHWEVDMEVLRLLVPGELEIDLFEGKPWVSCVAFSMEKIRPWFCPAFPPISNFEEINIRTYVKHNNKSGVYFLSIEGGKYMSCKIARKISALPYRHALIRRTKRHYHSENKHSGDKLEISYSIEGAIPKKSPLDLWLTERYALFQDTEDSINAFDIHHLEWHVCELDLHHFHAEYPKFNHLINRPPDKVQYSPGVRVLAWEKTAYLRKK